MNIKLTIAAATAIALSSFIGVSMLSSKNTSTDFHNYDHAQAASVNNETATLNSETLSEVSSLSITEVPQTQLKELEITDKDTCYHKLLNSIDYYNTASGKIETNMLNGNDFSIEYNVDMNTGNAYQHVVSFDFDEEVFCENGIVTIVNNLLQSDNISSSPAVTKSADTGNYDDDGKRVDCENGIMSYHYRLNPTNLHYASTVSIFFFFLAFGFLSDKELWNISGKENYLNRETFVIEGSTSPEYGAKLNINNFKMNIDSQTGILLGFEGYDASGVLTNYMKTVEFSNAQ